MFKFPISRKRWMPDYQPAYKKARVVPGYTRTGGYFGRFKGSDRERKFHDVDVDDAVIAAGGNIAIGSCNVIAQGVTEVQRVGRQIHIKKIQWRWEIVLPATATAADTCDIVRIVLYWDRQTNGAAAGVTDILDTNDFQSFNNLAHRQRFKILYDKTVTLVAVAGSGIGADNTRSYGCNLKLGSFFKNVNIPIEFDASTGAITEQVTNNLGVMLVSSAGLCAFNSKMRLRFTD